MIVINLIFRLLNFCILVGLFRYAIKYYVIPSVSSMIAEYEAFKIQLKNDHQQLEIDSDSIIDKTKQQELQFESLQVKFLLWQEKCQSQKEVDSIDEQKIKQSMHNRFVMRSDVYANELVIKEQLPYILDRATQALQIKYHKAESQDAYIKELICVMKEQL